MNINNLLNQAIELHKKGFLDQAKKIYAEIHLKNPTNFEIINLLGVIALQEKEFEKAINLIEKAIILNPHHHALYNNLGTALKEKGKFNEFVMITFNIGFSIVCLSVKIGIDQFLNVLPPTNTASAR